MAQSYDSVVIQVDLPDVGDYPIEPKVGTIWECAINGQGYMLANDPVNGIERQRGTIPLLPDRLAVSNTPFSEAINRYTFYSQAQFEGGQGQRLGNRDDTDPLKFQDGAVIHPFEESEIEIGRAATEVHDTGFATPRMVVVDDTVFVQGAADELDYSIGGAFLTLSGLTDTTGAVTISGLTSDGNQWYAATGRSVIRGTTSNPGADWSTQDAVDVQYAASRIMATVKGAGSSTPNVLTVLSDAGAEETTGGLYNLPAGHTIDLGGVVNGFYFFAGYAGKTGAVYAWQLGLNQADSYYTPFEAWTLPVGSTFLDVSVGGNSLWIQVEEGGSGDRVLYQAVPNQAGQLDVIRVADEGGAHEETKAVEHNGLQVMMWPGSSLAAVGLKHGGLAKWTGTIGAGTLIDLDVWQGNVVVTDDDGKLWSVGGFASSGWFTTPVYDGNSTLDKVFDDITLVTKPLSANESVEIEYSTDQGASFASLATIDTSGATRFVIPLGITAQSLTLRVTMNGPGTTSPTVTSVSARLHPLGLVDGVLVLPIICADEVEGLNGQIVAGGGLGKGALLTQSLEALSGQRVKVQDIDYPYTQRVDVYEVLQVESTATWLQVKQQPKLQSIAMVTLRKTVSR